MFFIISDQIKLRPDIFDVIVNYFASIHFDEETKERYLEVCRAALKELALSELDSYPTANIPLRLMKAITTRSKPGNEDAKQLCTDLFNMGYVEKLYTPSASHFNYTLKAIGRISLSEMEVFVAEFPDSDLLLFIDTNTIYELFLAICSEKHRTDPVETRRRIMTTAAYMRLLGLPLTVTQENILKQYNLLDETIEIISAKL